MKKGETAVLLSLVLVAAAPALADAPLAIQEEDLYQYWRPQSGAALGTRQAQIKGFCERARVMASYTIDKDGFTRDVEIIGATGMNPFYEQYVRNDIVRSRFTPAPANEDRQPVQLTETYRFECPPGI